MSDQRSGPEPERGAAPAGDSDDDAFRWPTGDESPAEVGRTAVRGLVSALVGRVMLVHSSIFLLLGAGLLTGAWALAREELARRDALAAFDGRAPGVIEAPWWRLDLDPEVLGDGTNWQALATTEVCARLRFRPVDGAATTTAFCRRHQDGLPGGHFFTWEEALGPVPVRWLGPDGRPRIELRLGPRLVRWLEERGPEADVFWDQASFHGPVSARRADRLLASLWREVDDPFLHLLGEWSKPAPAVTVAYATAEPARAAPLALLEAGFTVPTEGEPMPGWVLALILGFFGTVAWTAGANLVTGSRRATAVLVVAGLAIVPWAGGLAGRALGHLWGEAELALAVLRAEMLDLPPELVLAAPIAARDGDEVVVWDLERSSYAELVRRIDLQPPAEATGSGGVLRHLADQVRRQAADLPDEELAALLDWAATVQERGGGEEVGLLFVDAAVELVGDESRPGEVRWQAERLLDAVAFHRPSDNPLRGGADERARILARVPAR